MSRDVPSPEPLLLADLPRWSPWPARLLGLSPWQAPTRSVQKVAAEYDGDKYARCLTHLESTSVAPDPEALKLFELDGTERVIAFSEGGHLFRSSLEVARQRFYAGLERILEPAVSEVGAVLELGCGYGYNLWRLARRASGARLVGGEYSPNAVTVARRLFGHDPRIEVHRFDYYAPESYGSLFAAAGEAPVVVFTSHSIEQLPSAEPFLRAIFDFRERITRVFHFEPVVDHGDDSLLGMLRRGYARANDYNQDLWELLAAESEVEILRREPDLIGINPLNPTTLVEWRFRNAA